MKSAIRTGLAGIVALLTTADHVLAKIPAAPGEPPDSSPLMTIVICTLLAGLVCAGLWKSAKRTHQD